MRWLCSCLGQRGAGTHAPEFAKAVESDDGLSHVVVKPVVPSEGLPVRNLDVHEDKDQGNARAPQEDSTPRARATITNHQCMTWSPGQVSLDLSSLSRRPSISELQKQERTLRALLDRVNKFGNHSSSQASSFNSSRAPCATASSSWQFKMYDPEVSRLNQQILKCTSIQRPGTEAFDRAAQLLQDLRAWLSSSKHEGSAAVLLFGAGEALAHSEHMARSAGQVRFWSAPVVRQLVALLHLYSSLMDRCMVAAPSAPAPAPQAAAPEGSWRQKLSAALVQLLVRPSLLELLCEVLELVHLDAEFEAKSQRHEAVGAAICVLDFMRGLVRFAGAQLVVVDEKSLGQCLRVLADLLSPSGGLLPRVLQQPLQAENMTVQLHALFLLQQLFDSPPPVLQQLLRSAPAAPSQTAAAAGTTRAAAAAADDVCGFYIGHHLTAASRCYFASSGNPASALAELCALHVRLLRSLGRGTTGSTGPRLQLNDLLLSELAAEYEASQVAAAAAAAADGSGSGSLPVPDSDGEDSDGLSTPKAPGGAPGPDASPGAAAAAEKSCLSGAASSKFEFTYDLNEDLERILALEEKLGQAVEVSGFEYDQEGRQLLHRNSVMAAEAEAARADGAPAGHAALSGRPSALSEGGRPAVPKLSFSSFSRSALSSSRSLAPSGTAREEAPSARVLDPASSLPSDPTLTPATPTALPPSPPTAVFHLQQQLGTSQRYHSPSRFSAVAVARSRSRSSSSAAADARTGSPSTSVHFDSTVAAVTAPLRVPGPLVPLLDLSALGSGRSLGNTRRSSAANTAGGSGGGGGSGSGGARSSGGGTANPGGRRHIPDSAIDAGGKVDSKPKDPADPAAATVAKASNGLPDLSCRVTLAAGSEASPRPDSGDAGSAGGDPLQRLMFRDPKLHALLLGCALDVTVTPQGGLDPAFWQQYPLDTGLPFNLEYLLMWHLNSGAGAGAVPDLRRRLDPGAGGGSKAAAARARLLRLLAKQLFDGGRYSELKFLARGAFSNVFRAKARGAAPGAPQQQVIIKSVPLPASCFDRCVLPDVYSEVAIMDQYKGCPGICQLLDYGLTDEAFWIVMRRYRCSLAEWRQRQTLGPASAAAAALYLSILLQVVAALKLLAHDSVVHFDLKCSNILIDPRPGTKDSELWNPLGAGGSGLPPLGSESARRRQQQQPPGAPFQAVLADFGEARSYRSAEEAFTVRTRGTEVYKSPEMLLMNQQMVAQGPPPPQAAAVAATATAGAPRPGSPAAAGPAAAARAALQGAGLASDVWSLGCLAFELLSGKVLFGGDYASVTHRVAFGGRGNLALNPAERATLGDRPELVGLIEWVLARDPAKRPSLEEIEARARQVLEDIWRSPAPGAAASEQAPRAAVASS